MKRFVLILQKMTKFVFRVSSSRLSSRGAAFEPVSKLLETKFVSKLLENAVKFPDLVSQGNESGACQDDNNKCTYRAVSHVGYSFDPA